jgi:hypothetical protein
MSVDFEFGLLSEVWQFAAVAMGKKVQAALAAQKEWLAWIAAKEQLVESVLQEHSFSAV